MTHKPEIFSILKPKDILREISPQDFLNFGLQDMAYVKPTQEDKRLKYVIHAADGTALSSMDTQDMALAAIMQNDLEPVSTH